MSTIEKGKASFINRLFAEIVDDYDLLNNLLSFGRDRQWRRFALSQSAMNPGGKAIDIATGTGEMALEMARQSGGKVIGIDFCEQMLVKAKSKSASSSDAVSFVLADAEKLPFPDNVFDCATIGFTLRNVTSVENTFREMARVVKRDGKVISLELFQPQSNFFSWIYRFYLRHIVTFIGGLISGRREAYAYLQRSIENFCSPEEIKQIMEKAGLKAIKMYPLTLGTAVIHVGTKSNEREAATSANMT